METLKFLVGGVLPYIALVVFLGGMIFRVQSWRKLPSGAMTLFPAPATELGNLVNTLQEAALFKSLRRGDPALWVAAWSFHAVLALILLGHLRVFTGLDAVLVKAGMTEADIQAMSGAVGGAAGIVIGVAALALILRRLAIGRVREITHLADYAILLLIGVILATGNWMRFSPAHFDLNLARAYFASLATFGGTGRAVVLDNPLFLAHLGLALLLLMLMPFSKLLHLGGIFFTHSMIRKH